MDNGRYSVFRKYFHCFELLDRNGISPQWTLQSGDLNVSVLRMEYRLLRTGDNTKFVKLHDKLTDVYLTAIFPQLYVYR
jgi:hypothetical protein